MRFSIVDRGDDNSKRVAETKEKMYRYWMGI